MRFYRVSWFDDADTYDEWHRNKRDALQAAREIQDEGNTYGQVFRFDLPSTRKADVLDLLNGVGYEAVIYEWDVKQADEEE